MGLSQLLFSAKGRIPRSTYWYYSFAIVGATFITSLFFYLFFTDDVSGQTQLLLLVFIIPTIFVSIKRCHDRNHSGWYLLLMLIPIVSFAIGIDLAFFRGTVGDNPYGPDPLQKK
jgi:uncharacterized membrane protein YhaH (DUF805 family)